MTTALIGVIVLILLIISFVPNYRAMKSAKEQEVMQQELQLW